MKIAAICAFPAKWNTGMLTVDAALHSFVSRRFPHAELTQFTIERPVALNAGSGGLFDWRLLTSRDQLKGFDAIVFWGDFLHCRRYHAGVARRAGAFVDGGPAAVTERIFECLLLEDAPDEMLGRVICFGNSLYVNNAADDADPRYRRAISRLYARARLVLLRDPLSAQFANRFAPTRTDTTLGVDPAFLLNPDDLEPLAQSEQSPGSSREFIGFSFGRSLSKTPEMRDRMQAMVQGLHSQMGLSRAVDIRWLKPSRDVVDGVRIKLDRIRSCAVVVTDTYHCAINAWREGVPAVCIGRGIESPRTTVSEKKKELLYMMFNLRPFYLFAEGLSATTIPDEAVRLAELLNGPAPEFGRAAVSEITAIAERRLVAGLEDLANRA